MYRVTGKTTKFTATEDSRAKMASSMSENSEIIVFTGPENSRYLPESFLREISSEEENKEEDVTSILMIHIISVMLRMDRYEEHK